MAWAELDGAVWTLPAARNKTKLDLVRPLSKSALACLPRRDGEFVFGPVGSLSAHKLAFDKAVHCRIGPCTTSAEPLDR
jgi:hypothetical protein